MIDVSRGVFGKRLAELRKNRDMTQTDLAKQMDMSHSSVASWETGTRDPDSNMISALSDFFGVTSDYLLGLSEDQSPINVPVNKGTAINYPQLLDEYVSKSGLSLNEIVKKMAEKGVKIDRSYISMLKNNGTKNPASEEINRALAEATGGDPDTLVLAAYLDRAPDVVKKAMRGPIVINMHEPSDSTWKERALKAEQELANLKQSIKKLIS